mgnify:CR=1 FL=1
MSDLIDRNELLVRFYCEKDVSSTLWGIDGIENLLLNAPTVEAKPVVHCKDCEHWGTGVAGETEHVKCCEYGKYMVGENGYCCYVPSADMTLDTDAVMNHFVSITPLTVDKLVLCNIQCFFTIQERLSNRETI